MLFLTVESHCDAAHYLASYDGPCARMHGHRWLVRVTFGPFGDGSVVGDNMIADFGTLRRSVESLTNQLDHQILNEVLEEADPTAEFIVLWLAKGLKAARLKPARIDVFESPGASVTWTEGK